MHKKYDVLVLCGEDESHRKGNSKHDKDYRGEKLRNKAYQWINGKRSVDHIVDQLNEEIPGLDDKVDRILSIGELKKLEESKTKSEKPYEMIEQGSSIAENIWKAFLHTFDDHMALPDPQLTHYFVTGSEKEAREKPFERNLIKAEVYAELAYLLSDQPKSKSAVTDCIDKKLDELFLRNIGSKRDSKEIGDIRSRNRFIGKFLRKSRLLDIDEYGFVRFNNPKALEHFLEYYTRNEKEVVLVTGDGPFVRPALDDVIYFYEKNPCDVLANFTTEKAIEHFYENGEGIIGDREHLKHLSMHLKHLSRICNIHVAKPNKVRRLDLMQKLFDSRKGAKYVSILKILACLLLNKEDLRERKVARGFTVGAATLAPYWAFYRTGMIKYKPAERCYSWLRRGLTFERLRGDISKVMKTNIGYMISPYATSSFDLDWEPPDLTAVRKFFDQWQIKQCDVIPYLRRNHNEIFKIDNERARIAGSYRKHIVEKKKSSQKPISYSQTPS